MLAMASPPPSIMKTDWKALPPKNRIMTMALVVKVLMQAFLTPAQFSLP